MRSAAVRCCRRCRNAGEVMFALPSSAGRAQGVVDADADPGARLADLMRCSARIDPHGRSGILAVARSDEVERLVTRIRQPRRQSSTPTTSQSLIGFARPRTAVRCGTSVLAGAYASRPHRPQHRIVEGRVRVKCRRGRAPHVRAFTSMPRGRCKWRPNSSSRVLRSSAAVQSEHRAVLGGDAVSGAARWNPRRSRS